MKKLREHKFHSRSLIPSSVVAAGADAIAKFEDIERGLYRFHEGEKVVHTDNHEQIMTVQQVIRVKEKIRGQERNRLDGIQCHWWEDS